MCVIGLDKIFFYNLFSVVRAPGFLVRYRMCIGTKFKKNIHIFQSYLVPTNTFPEKKTDFLMDGNWKLRCEDPDIQNQTMYSHCLKLPRAKDIACDNCCDFYCLKSIYLLNIFIFLTRRNFRAQKNAPHFFFVFVPLAAHGKYFLIFFYIFFHIPDMDRDFVIQFRYFIVALERTKKIAALPQNKMLVAISVWLGSHAHILGFFQE